MEVENNEAIKSLVRVGLGASISAAVRGNARWVLGAGFWVLAYSSQREIGLPAPSTVIEANTHPAPSYSYRPRIWFHRTSSGSRKAARPRSALTLVPGTSFHSTGTSTVR
jgi:hypothetical protein